MLVECDANWAPDDDKMRRSTSCVLIEVKGFQLMCRAVTQKITAQSSGESEFYAIGTASCDALYSKHILEELFRLEFHIRLLSDSSAARAMSKRQGVGKVRHLDIKMLFIQRLVKEKQLVIEAIATQKNRSDIGTKHHPRERLEYLRSKIGLAKIDGDFAIEAFEMATNNSFVSISNEAAWSLLYIAMGVVLFTISGLLVGKKMTRQVEVKVSSTIGTQTVIKDERLVTKNDELDRDQYVNFLVTEFRYEDLRNLCRERNVRPGGAMSTKGALANKFFEIEGVPSLTQLVRIRAIIMMRNLPHPPVGVWCCSHNAEVWLRNAEREGAFAIQ